MPPFATSFTIACLCSQTFMLAESMLIVVGCGVGFLFAAVALCVSVVSFR